MTFNYTTIEGETWGSIAWKMYGSMSGITTLIQANPSVPMYTIFPTGTVLYIPIVDDTDSSIISSNLPIWKS